METPRMKNKMELLSRFEQSILERLPSHSSGIARSIWFEMMGDPEPDRNDTAFNSFRQKINGILHRLEGLGIVESDPPEKDDRGYWIIIYHSR